VRREKGTSDKGKINVKDDPPNKFEGLNSIEIASA